jgi:hypothetical protein
VLIWRGCTRAYCHVESPECEAYFYISASTVAHNSYKEDGSTVLESVMGRYCTCRSDSVIDSTVRQGSSAGQSVIK